MTSCSLRCWFLNAQLVLLLPLNDGHGVLISRISPDQSTSQQFLSSKWDKLFYSFFHSLSCGAQYGVSSMSHHVDTPPPGTTALQCTKRSHSS
ncbi:hypothetical protein H4582DRAFT_1959439 [Lactarius indigo]|nr:hypothetical protein H4582DRAFT_1959439 [Lactarius indigo]